MTNNEIIKLIEVSARLDISPEQVIQVQVDMGIFGPEAAREIVVLNQLIVNAKVCVEEARVQYMKTFEKSDEETYDFHLGRLDSLEHQFDAILLNR